MKQSAEVQMPGEGMSKLPFDRRISFAKSRTKQKRIQTFHVVFQV